MDGGAVIGEEDEEMCGRVSRCGALLVLLNLASCT
jgi:hypothetical protein